MKRSIMIFAAALVIASCTTKHNYDAVGYFEATEVTVSSEATGRVLAMNIKEGDVIEEGFQVGSIDSTQLYLNRLQLQKSAKSVISNRPDVNLQVAALETQLDNQKREKMRVEKLVSSNAVPSKQLDDINAAINTLQKQIAAQKKILQGSANSIDAQSSALDVQIALVEDQLSKCRMKAPVGGTILATYIEKGEFAVAGRPIYKVADLQRMTLRAYVTSDLLVNIKIGQPVKVTAQFGGDNKREYEGTIASIASQSEFTPKNIPTNNERADMVYAVKISVINDGYIKIGTYAEVKL